jgi:hypothetical protein
VIGDLRTDCAYHQNLCPGSNYLTNTSNNYNITQYSIGCWNGITQNYDTIINGTGQLTNETNLVQQVVGENGIVSLANGTANETQPPSVESKDNYLNYVASTVGSIAGLGGVKNLLYSQPFLALIIALSLTIAFAIMARNTSKWLGLIFIGILFIFTVAFHDNLLMWTMTVLIGILDAGIVTGYFSKIFGGG